MVSTTVFARPQAGQTVKLPTFQGRIMLQFSFGLESNILVPDFIERLEDDTMQTRESRKSVEGKHSRQIIQEGPFINIGSISGVWKGFSQIRTKMSNNDKPIDYQMVRFFLFTNHNSDYAESTDFLHTLIDVGCWKARGYHNSMGLKDSLSLNFGQLCKKPKAIQEMSMTSDNLTITSI